MVDIISDKLEQLEATSLTEENLQLFISGVKDYAIFMLDPSGLVTTWNEGAARIKGYGAEEIIGQHFSKFYTPEAVAEGKPAQALTIASVNGRYQEKGWRIRKDNSRFWAEVVITALRDERGILLGFGKVTRDLTESRRAELALRESEKKFRLLADNVPQLVWMCGADGLNIYFNQRWVDYTGLGLEASYGRGWNTPFHPDDKQAAWDAWNRAVGGGVNYEIECRLRAEDGSYRWFFIKGVPLHNDKGDVALWCGTCTEINSLKENEGLFHSLALHDDLTGLLNRRGFRVLADHQLNLTTRTGKPFLLIFADIDGLKNINDTMGHVLGNEVIVETANILRSAFRQSDIVARFGGDEFVILALESGPCAEVTIREKLALALEAANSQPNRKYNLSFSIGIVSDKLGQSHLDDLLANADGLMYKEKNDKVSA
jgi:diguanylate cyclase (GGDEF)-like protein/PAS domain S-box-containing protein